METHDGTTDLKPDQSRIISADVLEELQKCNSSDAAKVMSEPDFIELVRIVKRLPAERRDQLYESLWNDQLARMTADADAAIALLKEYTFDQF